MLLRRQNWHAQFIGPKSSEVIFFLFSENVVSSVQKMNPTSPNISVTPISTQHNSRHDNLTAIGVIKSHTINKISFNLLLSLLMTSSTGHTFEITSGTSPFSSHGYCCDYRLFIKNSMLPAHLYSHSFS